MLVQPPQTVYVGDPFQVAVGTVINSGSPTFKSFVQAGVIPDSITKSSIDTSNPVAVAALLNQLGSSSNK